jgi:PAS domain S-box-containing protein
VTRKQGLHEPPNSGEQSPIWEKIFHETILPSASLILWAADPFGILKYAEGMGLEQLGWNPKTLGGKSIYELFPDVEEVRTGIHQALEGNSFRASAEIAGLIFDISFTPVFGNDRKVSGVAGVCTNITEQKQMEIQLRESEDRFRRLSEVAFEGIAITIDGRIVDANQSLANLLGFSSYEVLGMEFCDRVSEASLNVVKEQFLQGYEEPYEAVLKRKDGSFFPAEISAKRIPFQGHKALVAAIRDITVRKKAEEEIRSKNEELNTINTKLQETNQELLQAYKRLKEEHEKRKAMEEQLILAEKRASLGTMAAGIGHEISQPLNALKITVDGIEFWFRHGKQINIDTIREKLKKVSGHANRINEIINYMRSVYKHQAPTALEFIDLNATVERALSFMNSQLLFRGIETRLKLATKLPKVRANSLQMEQVLMNIVQNASQALLREFHGDKAWMEVKTSVGVRSIRLSIADNGPGLGENIQRIFDPFYTSNEVVGGMGLGLCIVENLVATWKGKVLARNRKGGGAIFTIELPLREKKKKMKDIRQRSGPLG